jgi:hypothetical protein
LNQWFLVSFHEVIRLSLNPIDGYEEDVGIKTTIRGSSGAVAAVLWNDTYLTSHPERAKQLQGLKAHWLLFNENQIGTRNFPGAPGLYLPAERQLIRLLKRFSPKGSKLLIANFKAINHLHFCVTSLDPWASEEQRNHLFVSSGARSIYGVLPYCKEIDLYGFSDNSVRNHYFSEEINLHSMHPFELERRFVRILSNMGVVNLR